jgi:DNA-binding response OmpR family regulator
MDKPRILIVDDEQNLRFILEKTLHSEEYSIDTISDGEGAISLIKKTSYDLVLLDLNMTPIDGLQVLDVIREQNSDTVVIILTGHGTIDSAVKALRLGAFDYLYKPASPEAIRDRVREGIEYRQQMLRRSRLLDQMEALRKNLVALDSESKPLEQVTSSDRFLSVGALVIDKYHRSATIDGKLLNLTTTEYNLLLGLAEAAPSAVTPRNLASHAMGYDIDESEAREIVKYHIYQLRQKIEPDIANPKYIKTIRYKGYLWSG